MRPEPRGARRGGGAVLRIRYAILISLALAAAALAAPARESDASYTPPAAPPPEFQALYSELSQRLTAFESQLDAEWDGSVGAGRFAAGLAAANGNKTVALLTASAWTRILEMLDAFQAMGVELVKLDMHYPVLTPAFHAWLAAHPPPAVPVYTATLQNFIGTPSSFYNRLAAEIRSRGLGLWIEHSTLFGDYTATPPAGYFADMRTAGIEAARARYTQERVAETVLVVSQMAPDYYSLVEEPTTQNANFGYFSGPGGAPVPIYDEDQWLAFAAASAAALGAAVPGSTTLLGAGSGTWETRAYIDRFAQLPELDYIDMHLYPLATLGGSFLQNALSWADYVRGVAPGKLLTIGESWLYKASAAEVSGGLNANDIFGRDVYSFWEPLDRQFLEVLFKLAHRKQFEAVMPFWSQYYFAYLTYGEPGLEGLGPIQLIGLAGQRATPNVASVTLTGTGEKFQEVLARARDADGDGIPDSADSGDADGDGLADQTEHYCGSRAGAAARVPERLDGPFAGVDDDGDRQVDEPLPAGSEGHDCDGDGFRGSAEDHVFGAAARGDQRACGTDGWPADLIAGGAPSSTNLINVLDMAGYIAPVRHVGTNVGQSPGNVRWDISPWKDLLPTDINVVDMSKLVTLAPPMLGGQRAFLGRPCPWPPPP